MPGRDGTGPMGRGSMTGGFGKCAGRGAVGPSAGRGLGRSSSGRGMRRMFRFGGRFGFNAPGQESDQTQEAQSLIRQNEALRSELDVIRKRVDEMENKCGDA